MNYVQKWWRISEYNESLWKQSRDSVTAVFWSSVIPRMSDKPEKLKLLIDLEIAPHCL